MTRESFARTDTRLGKFTVRAVDPVADAVLLHGWLTHPKSAFWMMQDASLSAVERQFTAVAAATTHDAFLGLHKGQPAFLVESYDPADSEIAEVYERRPGDVGMHFLVAPTERPVHGFTRAVVTTVLEFLFDDPATRRIVVEPDVRNRAVHALNAAMGFHIVDTVALAGKEAYLSTCSRAEFTARAIE